MRWWPRWFWSDGGNDEGFGGENWYQPEPLRFLPEGWEDDRLVPNPVPNLITAELFWELWDRVGRLEADVLGLVDPNELGGEE